MRARYLGPGWELAKIRGTRFNMGAGLNMALAIGARPYGNFSGCHSVAWDINAPPYGDLTVGDQFQKHNYPFGILINAKGERYVDEGANFHSHTYAKYGGEIMRQPGMFAWQVFDAKAQPLLRGEYRIRRVTKAEANTLEELAPKLEGVDPEAFLRTVRAYNAACTSDVPFNPNILDGRSTKGLAIEKTNWAVALDTPPFHAYHVTTGVTFTFGGVKISKQGEVEDLYGRIIPGLYAAGEMVGGLFFHNYASGTGLMSGATFGRLAGAARRHLRRTQGAARGCASSARCCNRHAHKTAAPDSWRTSPSRCASKTCRRRVRRSWPSTAWSTPSPARCSASKLPWSQMVLAEALASGAGGPCRLPGVADRRLHVPQAALALGAFSHAFELDNLRKPGVRRAWRRHGGAAGAAMAQACGASGRDLITAIVAGIEVMFRIGNATLHSAEKVGFHAPGMTGPFGSAAACASLLKLSPAQTANAFGIAGSLAGGLLAFAKSGSGGMVKRLHLGRAAEGGVVAARLAAARLRGPPSVLEGRFGVLEAFCEETDASLLTKGLGETWEIERLCIKRYACHVTSHVPVQLLRGFIEQHGFSGDDIAAIAVDASAKVVSHHSDGESRRHHAGAVQRAVQSGARRLSRSARPGGLQRPDRGRSAHPRPCAARACERRRAAARAGPRRSP